MRVDRKRQRLASDSSRASVSEPWTPVLPLAGNLLLLLPDGLERVSRTQHGAVLPVAPDQHHADREPCRHACRNRGGGMVSDVERASVGNHFECPRNAISPGRGLSSLPAMPLIPAMRPFAASSSKVATPIRRPPTRALTGAKFSTTIVAPKKPQPFQPVPILDTGCFFSARATCGTEVTLFGVRQCHENRSSRSPSPARSA